MGDRLWSWKWEETPCVFIQESFCPPRRWPELHVALPEHTRDRLVGGAQLVLLPGETAAHSIRAGIGDMQHGTSS